MDMSEQREIEKPLLPTSGAVRPSSTSHIRRIASFLNSHVKDIFLVVGPLVFLILFFVLDIEGDTGKSGPMLAAMAWMFIWWVTEPVPLVVTALVPLFLFPILQIETASTVSKSYTNDTIFLILGSFILVNAVRFHNLHKRVALHIVRLFGSNPRLLLFGFCIGSAFISMWVDNAAAAAMLMPMAIAVQQKVHGGFQSQEGNRGGCADNQSGSGGDDHQEQAQQHENLSSLEKKSSMCLQKHLSCIPN
eukprot:c13228_g2_i1 orf=86-829(+)